MNDYSNLSTPELDDRIAILRDNIRQLVEQAAAASGEQSEERTATALDSRLLNSRRDPKSATHGAIATKRKSKNEQVPELRDHSRGPCDSAV
jgi:uncharacterized small protein (DUF1192 family)